MVSIPYTYTSVYMLVHVEGCTDGGQGHDGSKKCDV